MAEQKTKTVSKASEEYAQVQVGGDKGKIITIKTKDLQRVLDRTKNSQNVTVKEYKKK